MTSAKSPASSSVPTNVATSLSAPVSMLWAHQLRREHSALLARIEGMANAVKKVSPAQLSKVTAQAAKAETKSSNVESELVKLKNELDRAIERDKSLKNDISKVYRRLEFSEDSLTTLRQGIHMADEQLKDDLIGKIAAIEQKTQQDLQEQDRQVRELKTQYLDIRNQVPDIVKRGVIGVRNSMEDIKQQRNRTTELELGPETRVTNIDALHILDFVQPNTTRTNDMLIRPPNCNIEADLELAGDIDLNESMLTPDPVPNEIRQTMAMLPETPTSIFHQHQFSNLLKQGKFQNWDQYLTAGEALMVKLPKRKEGAFVEAFVAGIYDEKLRRKCEMTLDEVRWCWESVKDFSLKFAVAELGTRGRQRTETLNHRHQKGEICPVCSKRPTVPQSGDTIEIANSSPRVSVDQSERLRRKSQRIHQQGQVSQSRAGNIFKPKLSESRTTKPVDNPQIVATGIPAQSPGPQEARADAEIAKEKSLAIRLEVEKLIGTGEKLRALGRGAQQKNFEVVKQDLRINKSTPTTPEVPRNKKCVLKTQHRPPAEFQPLTPINHTNHENSAMVPENAVGATASDREASEKENPKKRKLVELLEVPDTTKRKPVRHFDVAINYSDPKEAERKTRRKKGALAAIPIIPILPLSDDE